MVLRPGWFPEYSPAEQLVFDQVKKIIEANYSQYGFAHIETPAVEATSVLLAKNGEKTVNILKNGTKKNNLVKQIKKDNLHIYGINNLTDRQIAVYKNKGDLE